MTILITCITMFDITMFDITMFVIGRGEVGGQGPGQAPNTLNPYPHVVKNI